MNAERLMLMGGVGAFLLTVYWVRRRRLRERYAIGWMMVATLLLLCGIFPGTIMYLAEVAHLSYAAAVLFISLGAMYFFSFFVTVSLSRQHHRNTRLLQEIAILTNRVAELEARQTSEDEPRT